VYNEKM